ncbi:MAG: VOC family protein [Balneolaceae bacterium]|jgi:hypothetical protein
MDKTTVLRIARPTDNLEELAQMYVDGLGFEILSSFKDHAGFDGIIIGHKAHNYHLEFTQNTHEPAGRAPTKDNLLVFYLPDYEKWKNSCEKLEKAGFKPVKSFNPYWDTSGKTFEDIDGYRIVLENETWNR